MYARNALLSLFGITYHHFSLKNPVDGKKGGGATVMLAQAPSNEMIPHVFFGISYCAPTDNFCRKTGRILAGRHLVENVREFYNDSLDLQVKRRRDSLFFSGPHDCYGFFDRRQAAKTFLTLNYGPDWSEGVTWVPRRYEKATKSISERIASLSNQR